MLQALIDKSQAYVSGRVRLKLYKGGVYVVGRTSPLSLYDQELVTFEEGAVAYDHKDAAGFIQAQCAAPADPRQAGQTGAWVRQPRRKILKSPSGFSVKTPISS